MARAWILMYHHVRPRPTAPWDVSPAQLEGHVRAALDRRFRCTTLGDALAGNGDAVALTFDDAYLNVYEHAYPVLAAMGVVATIFVPVACVGGTNAFDCLFNTGLRRPERIMTWGQLGKLARAGWSIQSHGCSHFPLDRLEPEHVIDEVQRSKSTIEEHLGVEVTAFSYPYGVLPRGENGLRVEEVLRAAGYRSAVLAAGGAAVTPPLDPYRIAREPVARDGVLEFTLEDASVSDAANGQDATSWREC